MSRRTLAALFITTGATALLAEQAYEKLLETLLGTTTHAAATVLTIYFAGLTIGGLAYRQWRRLNVRPLMLYAAFEAGIGLWALVLYAGFEHLISVFVPLLRLSGGNLPLLQLLRVIAASTWILPPTILMGSTFPAMVDALRENVDDTRRTVTAFYALNILGGTIAAIAGPYLIFATIGVDGALLVTAVDLLVAAIAFAGARRTKPPSDSPQTEAVEESEPRPAVGGRGGLLIGISCLCGFLFFALEVEWTHLIAAVCGNSVYSFAAMLASVLAGLFLGGVLAWRVWPHDAAIPVSVPAAALSVGAILLALQQISWPHVPHQFVVWGSSIESFGAAEGLRALVTGLVIVPPSTVIGAVFPLLFRLREFPASERGRVAGAMTAANAIGCCAGALTGAFFLIPRFGSEFTLLFIAVLYAATGALLLLLVPAPRLRAQGLAAAGLALLICGLVPQWDRLALTSGEHVYFTGSFSPPGSHLLFFQEDSAGGITSVIANPQGARVLLTNGKFQGSDTAEPIAQMGFALIPLMHASRFNDALVIGLGTGQSAEVVQAAGVRNVEIAEIAPGIIEAASQEFPHLNHAVLNQPNVHLYVEDGRNLLLLREHSYDLICIEISSYWWAGATNLYSRQFYDIAARRLHHDGMLQQWIQLHHTSPREIASALLTVRTAFRYVSLWIAGDQGIILASNEPQTIRPSGLVAVARALRESSLGAGALCSLLNGRLLSSDDIDRLRQTATSAVINTDRNRWIEYDSPRYNIGPDLRPVNIRIMRGFARPSPLTVDPAALPALTQLCPAAASTRRPVIGTARPETRK
jgi:spermidine synthase